jgi:hypothetical protein
MICQDLPHQLLSSVRVYQVYQEAVHLKLSTLCLQGFGRTFLGNSLKLPNTAWNMFVRNGTSVKTSTGQRYCVSVSANSGDLKVTLAW